MIPFTVICLCYLGLLPAIMVANGQNYDYSDLFTPQPTGKIYTKSRIGRVCRDDFDCGPREMCRKEKPFPIKPTPSLGICQCQLCHGYNADQKTCTPVTLKTRVCDRDVSVVEAAIFGLMSDDKHLKMNSSLSGFNATSIEDAINKWMKQKQTCRATCNPFSGDELYPPNAECSGDGLVVCSKCFDAFGNTCVARRHPNSTFGDSCTGDCDCLSGLKCRPTCRCPEGKQWDSNRRQCVPTLVKLGDSCQTNADCALNSDDPDIRFSSESGTVCKIPVARRRLDADNSTATNATNSSQNKALRAPYCDCAPGYTAARIRRISTESGLTSERNICVREGSEMSSVGDLCHVDPIEAGEKHNVSIICEPPATCVTCPEGLVTGYGLCRTVLGFTEVQKARNRELVWTQWVDQFDSRRLRCRRDRDCDDRDNQACVFLPVNPPCRYGFCACRAGFAKGSNGECLPTRRLRLGNTCNATDNEIYPPNSHCEKNAAITGNAVVCDTKFIKIGENCVPDTFTYVGFGSVCSDNCEANLVCSGQTTCQCPLTTQFWNETTCLTRQLGDYCGRHSDCDVSNPPVKRRPAGRVCSSSRGRCSCDKAFSVADCLYPRTSDNEWPQYQVNNDDDWRNNYAFCRNYLKWNNTNYEDDYDEDGMRMEKSTKPTTSGNRTTTRRSSTTRQPGTLLTSEGNRQTLSASLFFIFPIILSVITKIAEIADYRFRSVPIGFR